MSFDVKYDLLNDEISPEGIIALPSNLWQQTKAAVPNFFKPYEGVMDLADSAISPVIYPLGYSLLTLYHLSSSSFWCLESPYFLGAAGISGLSGDPKSANQNLKLALGSIIFSGLDVVLGAYYALMAVISIPVYAVAFVTRTLATVVSALNDVVGYCCAGNKVVSLEENANSVEMSPL